jgi:alkanesulfonate monooxygenase SsuD/methylene tetrahydromethanopterin reductase-like flavin-dependent oxidoreductase (luciferase family)
MLFHNPVVLARRFATLDLLSEGRAIYGFGRELSRFVMLEFVNIKSVRFYDQLIYEHHVE